MNNVDILDIMAYRVSLQEGGYEGMMLQTTEWCALKIRAAYDPGTLDFGNVAVLITSDVRVEMCVQAFAVISGISYAAFARAITRAKGIKADEVPKAVGASKREREKLGITMARQWIQEEVMSKQAQHNPAPGAQRSREAVVLKRSFKNHLDNMRTYFKTSPHCAGVLLPARRKLKQLWNEEADLVEKTASAHAKCDRCSELADFGKKLYNRNTAESRRLREQHKYLEEQHDLFSETERKELDVAGLMAISKPLLMWCIIVDAATQRNFGTH